LGEFGGPSIKEYLKTRYLIFIQCCSQLVQYELVDVIFRTLQKLII
jgi:hypothetical protein